MNKKIVLAFVATLGVLLVSSCDKTPTEDLIKEYIIGKWRTASLDGEPFLTNEMKVGTFATDEIYYSTWTQRPYWNTRQKWSYKIEGNTISYYYPEEGDEYVESVSSISNDKFIADNSYWRLHPEQMFVGMTEYTHIKYDYSSLFVGYWMGVSLEGEQTYGDENHVFVYKADGTYQYYVKGSNNKWTLSTNTMNEYVVDGDYLATRWVDNGVENREWWLIESCNDSKMVWTALRENEKGERFETKMELKRVESSILE